MISNTIMRRLSSVFLVTFLLVAGCKSGLNERCQLDDDCTEGLVCSPGAGICVDNVGGDGDAGVDAVLDADTTTDAPDIDAPTIDASPIDAAIDAEIDAPPPN